MTLEADNYNKEQIYQKFFPQSARIFEAAGNIHPVGCVCLCPSAGFGFGSSSVAD